MTWSRSRAIKNVGPRKTLEVDLEKSKTTTYRRRAVAVYVVTILGKQIYRNYGYLRLRLSAPLDLMIETTVFPVQGDDFFSRKVLIFGCSVSL